MARGAGAADPIRAALLCDPARQLNAAAALSRPVEVRRGRRTALARPTTGGATHFAGSLGTDSTGRTACRIAPRAWIDWGRDL